MTLATTPARFEYDFTTQAATGIEAVRSLEDDYWKALDGLGVVGEVELAPRTLSTLSTLRLTLGR